MLYVVIISRVQGMYGIYCTEARGLKSINAMHPDITILYPVGTATLVTIDIDTDLSFVTEILMSKAI